MAAFARKLLLGVVAARLGSLSRSSCWRPDILSWTMEYSPVRCHDMRSNLCGNRTAAKARRDCCWYHRPVVPGHYLPNIESLRPLSGRRYACPRWQRRSPFPPDPAPPTVQSGFWSSRPPAAPRSCYPSNPSPQWRSPRKCENPRRKQPPGHCWLFVGNRSPAGPVYWYPSTGRRPPSPRKYGLAPKKPPPPLTPGLPPPPER